MRGPEGRCEGVRGAAACDCKLQAAEGAGALQMAEPKKRFASDRTARKNLRDCKNLLLVPIVYRHRLNNDRLADRAKYERKL